MQWGGLISEVNVNMSVPWSSSVPWSFWVWIHCHPLPSAEPIAAALGRIATRSMPWFRRGAPSAGPPASIQELVHSTKNTSHRFAGSLFTFSWFGLEMWPGLGGQFLEGLVMTLLKLCKSGISRTIVN